MFIQDQTITIENIKKNSVFRLVYLKIKYFRYLIICIRSRIGRVFRLSKAEHEHFIMFDKVDLEHLKFDETRQIARGKIVEGHCFSSGYALGFSELPKSLVSYLLKIYPILKLYFGDEPLVSEPILWRNFNIPGKYLGNDIFSEFFHQDLVLDQYNLQLFVLIDSIDETQGPFEYLNYEIQNKDWSGYKYRNQMKPISDSFKLIGSRGDVMLFSTGRTLHRAGIPVEGKSRDLMSFAFFPAYTGRGIKFDTLLNIK